MTEQARPFKNTVNKIDTLDTPGVTRPKVTRATAVQDELDEETGEELEQERSVLDKLIASGFASWENLIWIGLVALSIFMHLVNLGPRAMHHDESIHASFSYDYWRGVNSTGAAYDPIWHGPLLYNLVALSYTLFGGATETNARLMPAFFGIGIVVICYLLRPIIGRIGALAAGIFMLFSPSILYYGRSLRHDIFATFGELLFVIGFFRFIQNKPGHKSWWLAIAGLGLVITYASHEMVFINTGILVAWLGVAFLVEVVALPAWVKNRTAAERETLGQTPETQLEEDEVTPAQWENREQELASEGLDQEHGPVGDPVLGNWGFVGIALFMMLAVATIGGSLYTFKSGENGLPAPQAFGLPQWLLIIPVGLLGALLAAYILGGFLAYGYSRLETKNVMVGRIAALGSFIILGALGVLSGLRNKPASTANPNASTVVINGAPLDNSDTYVLGMYVMPRVAFNLILVVIAALLIGVIAAWFWQRRLLVFNNKGLYAAGVVFFAVMLTSSLVSLRFAMADKSQGIPKGNLFLVGPEVDKWVAYVFNGFFLALAVAVFAGWLVSLANRIDDDELAGSAILRGALRVARQPMAVAGFVIAFAIPYILLFSTWFFNLPGLADGFYKGIEYWASAHEIRRLDQPWFYYPMLMLLYEILPLVFGFAALFTFPVIFVRRALVRGRCRFTVRGLFIGYTLWWSFLATIAYTLAGEKAPWLNMQLALPVILAAGAFLDFYVRRIPWQEFWGWTKAPLFALLFVLTFGAIGVIIGLSINLAPVGTLRTSQLIEICVVGVIGVALFLACVWMWRWKKISGRAARASIVAVVTLLLFGYTIKSTVALNYQHPDTAVEPLIYVQTAPEIPLFVQRLDRLSRDLRDTYKTTPAAPGTTQADPANSRGLPVLFSNEVAWPLQWYLRDYTDKNYFTPNNNNDSNPAIPSTTDSRGNSYVVIGMQTGENSAKVQQQLQGQYTPHIYKFRWWFPEDDSGYGGLGKDITRTDWSMIARSFTEQPFAGRLWRYIMYRELWNPLQAVEMVVYVRNDIDPNWGLYEQTGPNGSATGQTGAFGLFDAAASGSRDGQFHTPRDIAVASNGDILVLDSENARVQRFDKDGKFLSKFGGIGKEDGKFALAQFNSGPSGMAIDDEGNIYVADSWNYRIEKFDKDGKFLLKWGDGKDTTGDPTINQQSTNVFYGPRQLAFDKTHKELYVADTGNKRIMVFDPQGNYLRQFGSKGSGPGLFDEPVGVALSQDGSKVYVSDLRNKRVEVLDRNGKYLSEIKMNWNDQQPLAEPYLKTDAQDNLYVSDPTNGKVYRFDANGNQTKVYDNTNGANLVNPVGLAFDSDGNLLIADAKRNAVVKVTP
jgi:uncharacterized protein (TIGR03663 family)